MDPKEIKTLIENGLPGAQVDVVSDDNTHYAAVVICTLDRTQPCAAARRQAGGSDMERQGEGEGEAAAQADGKVHALGAIICEAM